MNRYKLTKLRMYRAGLAGIVIGFAVLTGYAIALDAPLGMMVILGGATLLAGFGVRLTSVLIEEEQWQKWRRLPA